MEISQIIYYTKIASQEEIFLHLKECSNLFSPALSETVNIHEYSKKIFLQSVTFEAWVNNNLIGLIAAYFNDVKTHAAYITNVSIIKEYSGLGLASSLLRMCINHAKLNNFSSISLEVNQSNTPAINLYKKHGFKIIKNEGNSSFMKAEF
jgi:ribosomal protein S18 acetylase RimI-like enzyme